METTLYSDNFRFGPSNLKTMKRPVTLNLDSPGDATKKQRLATVLTSPDLSMLKLSSPELERFIIQNGVLTTTPTPTSYLVPKNVTEEQEKYAKGFVDMLNRLHQTEENNPNTYFHIASMAPTTTSQIPRIIHTIVTPTGLGTSGVLTMVNPSSTKPTTSAKNVSVVRPPSVESGSSNSYQGGDSLSSSSYGNLSIKEEPQSVPNANSPPLLPINLENQERIKLERKRYRNRIAATKCRQKKLERISKLEDQVQELKDENAELDTVASKLREQIYHLKEQLLSHARRGCQIMNPSMT